MSCYFRHLDDLFREAGIEATKENKKEIDVAIHRIVGAGYKDCPKTWQKVKEWLADKKLHQKLVKELKEGKF